MPLQRTNPEIIKREAVSGTHGHITRIVIDLAGRSISCTVKWANRDADGNYLDIHEETFTIADTPEHSESKEEQVTVAAGKATLSQTPTANLKVMAGTRLLFEGADYTRNGAVLTLTGVADGTVLDASYSYTVPADLAFTQLARLKPSGAKTFYEEISKFAWQTLISRGLVGGTYEPATPLGA